MPVAKRPGYYVETRFFKDNYHQALARAKFLANEYGRKVDVMYLAPEDCGSVNNAVPYSVAECCPTVRNRPEDASPVAKFLPSIVSKMASEQLVPDLDEWVRWAHGDKS